MAILTSELITDLTQEIWSAFLSDLPEPLLPSEMSQGDVHAAVDITGEWNGTICLSCSTVAARHATKAIFGMGDDEIGPTEITDAIGELANIVSGNIKGVVPGPSVLSIPRFREGPAIAPSNRLELALEVGFSWMAEAVAVSVWTEERF